MKTSRSIALILSVAAIGTALPALADTAVVNENTQTAIVTGSNNSVNLSNNSSVRNSGRGGDTGTAIRNRQTADVVGNNNNVNITNDTTVENRRHTRR